MNLKWVSKIRNKFIFSFKNRVKQAKKSKFTLFEISLKVGIATKDYIIQICYSGK